MMKRLITTCLIAGLMVVSAGTEAQWISFPVGKAEAAQEWAFLGERRVGDNIDHDTIPVTVARGSFRRLKFQVQGHAIQMRQLVVHYGNGKPDNIETRDLIPAGGESRGIDLRGGDRVIRKIDFWYETKSVGRKRALIRVYGAR
jgi:hypothetical protein